jgi:hypothetical protein
VPGVAAVAEQAGSVRACCQAAGSGVANDPKEAARTGAVLQRRHLGEGGSVAAVAVAREETREAAGRIDRLAEARRIAVDLEGVDLSRVSTEKRRYR